MEEFAPWTPLTARALRGVVEQSERAGVAPGRWRFTASLVAFAQLAIVAASPGEEFFADSEASLVRAIADAAASADPENCINLDRACIQVADAVVIAGGFGPGHRLTIRPRPGLSSRPRTQLRSANGAASIVEILGAGHVELQDLDLLRTTYNRAHLLRLENATNVVVERCRAGSVSSAGGQPGWASIAIRHPVHVVVRNSLCFACQPGTFDRGIILEEATATNAGLWLYNNLVADHRLYGIDLTATGDSLLLLRNNVVVNHPTALDPEPAAYHSNVDPFVRVISSHNTAFASPIRTRLEQQDGAQDVVVERPEFLQLDRSASAMAFHQTRWNTQVAAHPNWNLFRLRDEGPLHDLGNIAGQSVGDGNPDLSDVAVTDDIEQDARPSNHGGVTHTDRGPDQFRPLTAGDIKADLRPRLPGLDPIRLSGGGFEIVSVGPQEDIPVIDVVMRGGTYTAGGGWSGLAVKAGALPRPVALAVRLDQGNHELKFSWPVWAEEYVLESAASVGGAGAEAPQDWNPVAPTPGVEADHFIFTTAPTTTGNRFYRLHRQE